MTLAVNARPAPHRELGEVRGALRPKSGVEVIYSSAPSSVTRTASRSGTFTLGLSPSAGYTVATGTGNTGSAGASASFSSNSSRSTSLTLSRNRQQWLRTYAPSAQFDVEYEYRVAASSQRLPDTVPGFLVNQVVSLGQLTELLAAGTLSASETTGLRGLISALADGMTSVPRRLGRALGRASGTPAEETLPEEGTLPAPATASGDGIPLGPLTASGERPVVAAEGESAAAEGETAESATTAETAVPDWEPPSGTPVSSTPVTVKLRFPASETPYEREDGTVEWSAAPELLAPQIHESDPREIRPLPRPEAAADPTADPTAVPAPAPAPAPAPDPLADTARWTPEQTLIVGDFDAVDQLADALRTVDPALRGEGLPNSSESHEATMLRIGNLVGSGKVTLTPAQASRFTGKLPSGGSAAVQLTLYRPQTESAGRSITLMGMRTTIRSASSTGSQTYSPGVNVPLSGGLTEGNADTFSGSIPSRARTSRRGTPPASPASAARSSSTARACRRTRTTNRTTAACSDSR